MTGYITYMEVSFSSEGATPSELTETLRKIGWEPIYGRYDYAYDWGTNWGNKDSDIKEFLDHMNKTHKTLSGSRVNYSLRTYIAGTEDFMVDWPEQDLSPYHV